MIGVDETFEIYGCSNIKYSLAFFYSLDYSLSVEYGHF